ncbi:hypothetical protein [Bacillus xiapuensis]|uniref:hypothetical protein n=1 Tax=Bacillus xiapuensis TaxID=2014075 RepID=UPI000C24FD03|nr:hypothetical protein [Bacillus xiapuensis]
MGYILPVPHYQYQQYQGRMISERRENYASIDQVERLHFRQALESQEQEARNPKAKQLSSQQQHEAFQMYAASIIGKGMQVDQRI